MAISEYIYGLHDAGGESHMGANKGWIVWTKAIGTSGSGGDNYSSWSNAGYGVIVRLNNGYESAGTLPGESQYDQFAQRCADYVKNSPGVDYWIIGNECNLPREWPGNNNGAGDTGEPITVGRYVKCYNKCYAAIKAQASNAKICPAATGTWARPEPAIGHEGFLTYWKKCLEGIGAAKIDGLILHAYTHGSDPNLVFSTEKMQDDPYRDVYYHFFVYKNLMAAIPSDMRTKPVMITECNQVPESGMTDAWKDQNAGWVQNIYKEINTWNAGMPQKIQCVALFRWEPASEGALTYTFSNKPGVIADFEHAVAHGYKWGAVVQSGDMVEGVPTGTNLARNVTVATDSDYSASYTGQKAIDGIISHESKWTSTNTLPPHWLKLDLGGYKTVTGFVVRHAESGGVDASYLNTQAFSIQSGPSFDGPWTNEVVVDNSAQAEETFRKYLTPKSLRYVRLFITDPGLDNHARIPEFEVWGDGGGAGLTIKQNFEVMPAWSSTFDAPWGGAAKFTIVTGGTIGNCLRARRFTPGSSCRVQVFAISPNNTYKISIWMRSPGGTTPYWAECAFKLGEVTAADLDGGNGWMMIKKISNQVSGAVTNGNNNVWTKYTQTFQSQAHTKISVGFKLGGQSDSTPVVKWDTLRIKVSSTASAQPVGLSGTTTQPGEEGSPPGEVVVPRPGVAVSELDRGVVPDLGSVDM